MQSWVKLLKNLYSVTSTKPYCFACCQVQAHSAIGVQEEHAYNLYQSQQLAAILISFCMSYKCIVLWAIQIKAQLPATWSAWKETNAGVEARVGNRSFRLPLALYKFRGWRSCRHKAFAQSALGFSLEARTSWTECHPPLILASEPPSSPARDLKEENTPAILDAHR